MPIWMRRFTHNSISEFYIQEKEQYEAKMNKHTVTENTDVSKLRSKLPTVDMPSYVSKAKRGK